MAQSGPAAIRGIPVEHPSRHEPDSSYTYVLSYFMDSATNVNRIFAEHLHQDILTVYDILTYFDPDVFSNGWQGMPEQYEHAMNTVDCFEDSRSQDVFRAAAEWRYRRVLANDFPLIPAPDRYNIPPLPMMHLDYILDGGSYDLSLASCLLEQGFSWDSYIAIEPDPGRGEAINRTLCELPAAVRPTVGVDARALWKEYEAATYGRRCIQWTPGLRAALVPDVEEVDDEELAAREGEDEALVTVTFGHVEWNGWVKRGEVAVVLRQVEEAAALLMFLARFGSSTREVAA